MTTKQYAEMHARQCRDALDEHKPAPAWRGPRLDGANLQGAYLYRVHLRGVSLSGANLRNAHLGIGSLEGADLSRADLSGAHLMRVDLSRADLSRANLDGAKLEGANLKGADMRCASLEDARLKGARLKGANLRGADLRGARLWGAILEGAKGLPCLHPDPRALRVAVADHIEAHPDLHTEERWGDKDDGTTPCNVATWACRLGGGTHGYIVPAAAMLLLHVDGLPSTAVHWSVSWEEIISTLRGV